MSRVTGQSIRRLGLTIEALSMLAMLGTQRGQINFWKNLGLDPSVTLTVLFLVGFTLWITGSLILRRHRPEMK